MALLRDKLVEQFQSAYDRLNDAQRKAVDQIEGPVMVIAGPGTGKTQILSARIGKILLSDAQVEPSNILCLTYTDAGVVAMRKRLVQFIGPDAYRVHIHTFHAFCNEVIQDNLSMFEKTALDPISDLERIELLKALIDSFPKDHPLKRYRGDVYFEMANLQSLFSLMKREGWKPDYICQKVDEYLNDLPNRDEYICKRATKEFKKGDVRWDKIEEQKERMEKLRAACNEFARFQKMMRERDRYDFDDMINWVIERFEQNESLLRQYQEQFQYILVDEYQDTSGSQNKIVQLLINFWDKPNVFVVGDDDQSIYRFQGANVENMLAFADGFKEDLMTVVLTNNYRSTQPILDVSKSLIDRNNERLVKQIEGLSKDLIASNPELVSNNGQPTTLNDQPKINHPHVLEFETQRDEMIGVVQRVEDLLKKGVKGSEIGIIYRENKFGDELADYLRLKEVPFYTKRSLNILDQPLIQQLLTVLEYIAAEHDIPYSGDAMLFEILHYEWFGIKPVEIAKASVKVSDLNYASNRESEKEEKKGKKDGIENTRTSIRQWVCDQAGKPPTDLFDTGVDKRLCEAVTSIEKLIGAVPNETLQGLLEKVIREGGFLSHIMNHPEKNWLLQLITGFYNHVKEETRRYPSLNLQGFLDRLALMRKEGLVLPLVQVAGNERGVNLMTAHGSKGLEFEYVFFVGCTSSCWEKKRKPNSGFSFPDTLFVSNAQENVTEELRRLFYVALTRARKHLFISYCNYTNEGKPLEPSVFMAEIAEHHTLPLTKHTLDATVIAEFSALQLKGRIAPELDKISDELADRTVHNFVMNVSALNSYLKCPLEFYFRQIVRIPSPRNEAAEFGSAIHHALEELFRKMQVGGKNTFPSLDTFIGDFVWYMRRHRAFFTKEQYARRLEYGTEILTAYYQQKLPLANKIVSIERRFKSIVDGIPLKGKLDKIEFNGKEATVIDYKTGDPEKNKEKFARPNPKLPEGGDYWRQAVFYKLMLDNMVNTDWVVSGVAFDFIEPTKKKEYVLEKVIINPQDEADVKAQIKEVHSKIQNKDFYTGCGKEDCHWCKFVKTNKLAVALHELQEDEPESQRNLLRIV
jgi:DNA helicase-2/ATP-dependent DNA helicase PcrA